MSAERYWKAHKPDAEGVSVDISPQSAGWKYSSLRVLTLGPSKSYAFASGYSEWIVLPLSGGCTISCENQIFELVGRANVFERVTDFAYIPRDASVSIHSSAGGRFALAGAIARQVLPARYGPAESVPVELRGAGNASRQVNGFASPAGFQADRLMAVEVLTPGGNWSSYPPHKHDEERAGEAELEEIYYFEIAEGLSDGAHRPIGYQRVYSSGATREIDVLSEVSTGDVVTVPFGYHGPSMAVPGYDMYYLNVLAGPGGQRTMAFCDDPDHAWIRDTWIDEPIDPRLPMTSFRGAK